ncbi:PREDICTED: COP9 signalosome complex subunit 3-like [Rhagoletis zephyria]|uniref:COP9 signalosome complex subunit 3-like n=1 Tax=Rhagoletis zephyria TaxID=28612 RepID=UPI0008117224|nr:PREDICTED: COP9 signalosome complex subunit 3-like [Rhagoletis zephyria]KAH9405838.1 COP9 signalosome complex subunit 3 [Tyrophagus putrescentiae]
MSVTEKAFVLIKDIQNQSLLTGVYQPLVDLILESQENVFHTCTSLDELMQQLDIQENTAAILCLLTNKISITTINLEQTFAQISEFISECADAQVKALPNLFSALCRFFTDKLIESKQYLRGVDPLCKAITKAQNAPTQLTSIHCDLLKLCLLSKCLKPALAFLDVDISDISREADTFDVKYYLLYYYYGGIIYATFRNFERSLFFLTSAISVTGIAISEIVVEAYKKYILVSLLVHGKVGLPPKQNANYLSRCIRPLSVAYTELASAYSEDNAEDLEKTFMKYHHVYERDTNVGLVKQVMASMVKVKIQKLTKTFMTLSFGDMATRVNLAAGEAEAESIILQMIEDEEIFASINQQDGNVLFLDKPEKYNSPAMYRLLEQELQKCVKLNEKLKELDQDIALMPKYQKLRAALD